MGLQQRICKAFCADVRVNEFRGGFGISTPFVDGHTGDTLGFYLLNRPDSNQFRLVDDALTVARFESDGASLNSQTRRNSFNEILAAYGGQYDDQTGELSIDDVHPDDVERRSLDFMAMLLRMQDMHLLTSERVKNTFVDDVASKLADQKIPGFGFEVSRPVSDDLKEVIPDFVLRHDGTNKPVALFLVSNNEAKIWQAMHLKLVTEYETKRPISVIALLESSSSVSASTLAKASNRLDAVPNWRGDETAAFNRILSQLDIGATAIQ